MASSRHHSRAMILLAVLAALSLCMPARALDFAGGTGTPDDPYQIATPEQLIGVGSDPNLLDKNFVLVTDIDLDPNLPPGRVFSCAVIAPDVNAVEYFQGTPFTGCFDGQGHAVRNLAIDNAGVGYVGLFGAVGPEGLIHNLRLGHVFVRASDNVGGLAGYSRGTIRNCSTESTITGRAYVGGLVGRNGGSVIDCRATVRLVADFFYGMYGGLAGGSGGLIAGCEATGTIDAHGEIGGLVGENVGPIIHSRAIVDVSSVRESLSHGGLAGNNAAGISCCYAAGNVSGGDYSGGLVGANYGSGSIVNCYASGNVSGGKAAYALGGLVGRNYGSIANCYARGALTPGQAARGLGGLVAESLVGTIYHCFWDAQTSGLSESAGGIGLSTAQIQDARTLLAAGWDLTQETQNGTAEPWSMSPSGGYPQLTVFLESYQRHQLEGAGTSDDPYRIGNAEDLGAVCHHDLMACYKLVGDIDLSGIVWTSSPIEYFGGRFDGGGFVLSSLNICGAGRIGLLGNLGPAASVTNLAVEDASIIGGAEVGRIAVLAAGGGGTIADCHVEGLVTGGTNSWSVGMMVGSGYGMSITDSSCMGRIWCAGQCDGVGGLGGALNFGSTTRCRAAVTICVDGAAQCVGGLVASLYYSDMSECYATTNTVTGQDANGLGGLVGANAWSTITNCYSRGSIVGGKPPSAVGGLVGQNWEGAITNCYSVADTGSGNDGEWEARLTGFTRNGLVSACYFRSNSAGDSRDEGQGLPLTDEQMTRQASFVGWDFADVWTICEGQDYPRLRWEGVECE